VHQDHPGNCPICGMTLVKRQDAPAAGSPMHEDHDMQPSAPAVGEQRRILYWYDPMVPQQHFDHPGKSPMGMDMVPKYADEPSMRDDAATVGVDTGMVQKLGMRTAVVRRGDVSAQTLRAVGSVAIDETRIVAVEARAAGWIEHLDVRAVGDRVQKGQTLAGLYAPDLLTAQEELALARRLGDEMLVDAARTKLRLLGGVENKSGTRHRTVITAPESGVVTELLVREGVQLTPGMPLMKIADLSKVWISIEVPEAQAGGLQPGQAAEARLTAMPGQVFRGNVDYVYPTLDPQTRTLRARVALDNADGALRPGMYADVALMGTSQSAATLVPTEAVIRTGARNVVIVAEAPGRYRPTAVTLGVEHGDDIVVLAGLTPGEQVITSGQFLIDSEANLQGAYNRMMAQAETEPVR
jgi:Cu(I)/Ag(I) efflux system membrane fusion protein